MRWKLHSFLLVLAVSISYLNSFQGIFQFDDYNVIVDNQIVHSLQAWISDLNAGIRPLLKLSYVLNWTSGAGLYGFHLVNVSVHAANVLMFYFLSLKIIPSVMSTIDAGRAALIASFLFAVHPVQTEAVTYISGRSSSLMSMFYLAAILVYIKGINSRGRDITAVLLHVFTAILFAGAVMVKETAVTLPFALLLAERTCKPDSSWFTIIKRQFIYYLLFIIIMIALIIHPNHGSLLEHSFDIRSIGDNILTQINGICYLLSRLVVLNGMNIDPDLPIVTMWSYDIFIKSFFVVLFFIIGVTAFYFRSLYGFGILWFFLHLLPTNSIVPRLDVANDRQLYLASAGLFFAASYGIERLRLYAIQLTDSLSKVITALTVALLITAGVFTVSRNHAYRSEIALWEDTRIKSPLKARVHNNLGYAYYLDGRNIDAKNSYLAALSLSPDYTTAKNNLMQLNIKESAE